MHDKRFDTYEASKPIAPPNENCSTCESYYMGACDGLRGWCKSYKQYRAKTLEELVKVGIGTTVLVGGLLAIIMLIGFISLH